MKFDGRNEAVQALSSMLSSRAVQIQTPQSSQQSAAEEVGMLFSQKVESSSKELSQRKLRTLDTQVQRIQGIEQLNELYEQLGHPGQLSLEQLARQVRQELLSKPDVEGLLTLTGGDPARTHVVLQHVTDQAQAQGRETEAALARDFQEQVQARYHPQIQAGVNIALALKTADGDAALRQAVRVLYYASVVVKQSLVSITQALLGLFGEEEISVGLSMMRRALADDLAAYRPSLFRPSSCEPCCSVCRAAVNWAVPWVIAVFILSVCHPVNGRPNCRPLPCCNVCWDTRVLTLTPRKFEA